MGDEASRRASKSTPGTLDTVNVAPENSTPIYTLALLNRRLVRKERDRQGESPSKGKDHSRTSPS
jgi:hypothetical protein